MDTPVETLLFPPRFPLWSSGLCLHLTRSFAANYSLPKTPVVLLVVRSSLPPRHPPPVLSRRLSRRRPALTMAFRAEAHTLHSPATHRPAPHGKVPNYQPAEYVRYTNDAPTPLDDWQLPPHGYYPRPPTR